VTVVSLHLFCRPEAESAVRVLNSAILDNRVVRATWRELVSAVVQAAKLLLRCTAICMPHYERTAKCTRPWYCWLVSWLNSTPSKCVIQHLLNSCTYVHIQIRVDHDWGYVDGRQWGRGSSGGQVCFPANCILPALAMLAEHHMFTRSATHRLVSSAIVFCRSETSFDWTTMLEEVVMARWGQPASMVGQCYPTNLDPGTRRSQAGGWSVMHSHGVTAWHTT
jgi:hypothetical protein